MATVFSNEEWFMGEDEFDFVFDMYAFNLSAMLGFTWIGQFYDNDPITLRGVTYRDQIRYPFDNSTAYGENIVLAGNNLTFDPLTREIGGTIRALAGIAMDVGPGDWDYSAALSAAAEAPAFLGWSIQGLSLSAQAVYDAAVTLSLVDDMALLSTALSGADSFTLGNGSDRALGFGGNDTMQGGGGNDHLHGGDGSDRIYGGAGHDQLSGNAGNDVLRAGAGRDVLRAGTGQDELQGGAGTDRLIGGTDAAADRFVLASHLDSALGANHDTILNFTRGADRIDLRPIDARPSDSGVDQAFQWSGTQAAPRSVWWVDSGADVLLRGDVTGDRTADFEILVANVAALSASDLLL